MNLLTPAIQPVIHLVKKALPRHLYAVTTILMISIGLLLLSSPHAHAQSRQKNNSGNNLTYRAPPDITAIKERGYLTVAMVAQDQVPFFFTNDTGEFTGSDVNLAKGIATELGVGIRFNRQAESFNDLIPIVASKKADMAISKLSRTTTRNQVVLFSNPYLTFNQALMFNRVQLAKIAPTDPEVAEFIKRFRGDLGVIANSSYVGYAKQNFPEANIIEFPTWEEVITAVNSGTILAGYRDELEVKKASLINARASLTIKTVLLSDIEDNIAIAISWESRHLLSWLNLYLQSAEMFTADTLLANYKDVLSNK